MPIPVTKYTCQFKCHRAANTLKVMTKHEAACTKNPENKTCRTCKHEIYVRGDEGQLWRGCKIDYMESYIEGIHHLLETAGRHIKPLVECPNYNIDTPVEQGIIQLWLNKVEINLTAREVERKQPVPDDLPF